MNVLVTGATGFAGSHLVEYLKSRGYTIFSPRIDLLNATDVAGALKNKTFDSVFHLAAIASTSDSYSFPGKVLKNNLLAQLNLLETLRRQNSHAKILIIGSADEYGHGSKKPITEDSPLSPASPYAVSKIAQDFMGLQYYLAYGMEVVRVRPFNHIGERQALGFVVPDFAKQIIDIERTRKSGVIEVGNLNAVRDFTDVKDMVVAYDLALEKGKPGDVYNLGSGRGVKIEDLLERLVKLSNADITIRIDKTKFRPGESPRLVCDASKFKKLTGWEPKIPLSDTLMRVLEWWRKQ